MNLNVKNVRKYFPFNYQFQIIHAKNLFLVPNVRVKALRESIPDLPLLHLKKVNCNEKFLTFLSLGS